jgi:hypothetical protein
MRTPARAGRQATPTLRRAMVLIQVRLHPARLEGDPPRLVDQRGRIKPAFEGSCGAQLLLQGAEGAAGEDDG